MAEYIPAPVGPEYNRGVFRLPGVKQGNRAGYLQEQLFADLLDSKDIVGGQVAEGFVGTVGTPLVETGPDTGVYTALEGTTDFADVVGVLLLATDAYDGPRFINVVKGGCIKTNLYVFRDYTPENFEALATALGGKYDQTFNTITF